MIRRLPLLLLAATACFVVDATDWALPLEAWLAERMASATRAVFVGLNADPALLGTVAPACAGLRTATAGAILGACLARRRWLGALVGALCGLGLNLVRLVAVEAALRVDVPFGPSSPPPSSPRGSGASAPSPPKSPSPPPPSPSPPSSSPSTSPTRERRSQRPTEASTERHRESNGWNPPRP